MRGLNCRRRITIARVQNSRNRQVTFSKRRNGLFKKASELCTLCGAYVAVVIFSSRNKIYSCGHPSVEFIVDKFLGENPQPDTNASNPDTDAPNPNTDAPNPIVVTHQNAYVDEINKKLNKLENSLEREKKYGEALQSLRNELPYEKIDFLNLKKLSEALEAADEEVERVASQLREGDIEFPYQIIGSALAPLRVEENNSSDPDEGSSGSHE
ncbi:agamous-like MADS-box protein AGL62 [Solanum tuberosum]|uniref:Mads box protein n=1 Tax=Solanum tuberosum TaxID=4113 RepID=M1DU30_SOLTU|nr:PREDICTED: agamous-like MADS-box protein AGL62 [Solanum tuberosum]